MAGFLRSRTVKYGSNAFTVVLMVLGILVVVNLLSDRYYSRFDLTSRKVFSLSNQTLTILGDLRKDVNVVAFFKETNKERVRLEDLLKQYGYHSRRFSYRFVDLDRVPLEAERYRVKVDKVLVVECGGREERVAESDEKALTNAIVRVIRDDQRLIYLLSGHGERSPEDRGQKGFYRARQFLTDANHDVRPLVLARTRRIPEDCDLLIVAGPQTAFEALEVEAIRSFLNTEGDALFLLDPLVETGLEPVLLEWSVQVNDDFVVDKGHHMDGADFTVPVASEYGGHPITEKHTGLVTFYPLVRSLRQKGSIPGAEVTALVMSSARSYAETNLAALKDKKREAIEYQSGEDRLGKQWLAMAVLGPFDFEKPVEDRKNRTRIVTFGDSDFVSNQFIEIYGNGDLFLNAINWLLDEYDKITIRPRKRRFRPLDRKPDFWIRWFAWIAFPAVPVVAGVIVWWHRRG
ncbi:MAG: Gldg family protein [bacterium]|nr:Gldg family protein [bacterium]